MPPNGKRASKGCNTGLVILLCIIFLLIGGGAGYGTYYYLDKVKKEKDNEDETESLDKYDREDETVPEIILSMTAEIKPVADPVKKDSDL